MAERGIIFSAPMVRALLDGRKTQTRRLATFVRPDGDGYHIRNSGGGMVGADDDAVRIYGADYAPHTIGDRLYVREAHAVVGAVDPGWVLYRASGYEAECERHGFDNPPPESEVRWTPSIHMPRWASRLTLTVTDVRVQRLQDISEDDARAEGVMVSGCSYRSAFHRLWNSLHDKPGTRWEDNPWLYALTFTVQHGNIDRIAQ